MNHFKVELAAELQRPNLASLQLWLTLQPSMASLVTSYYEVRTQKIVPPALQCAQDGDELSVGSIVILLCYGQPVQQVLHQQPGLPIITGLHQSGTNCVVRRTNPDFMGHLLI